MSISLRRRLTFITLGQTCVVWLIAVVLTTFYAQTIIRQQIDSQLNHYMDMASHTMSTVILNQEVADYFLGDMERPTVTPEGITRIRGLGGRGEGQATNLWFDSGQQILIGEYSPRFPYPENSGFKQVEIDGSQWRLLYIYDKEITVWMAVGVNLDKAENLGALTLDRLLLPLILVIPVSLMVILWSIKSGLKPVRRLAENIASRTANDLSPINLQGVPSDITPVVNSLNELLARLNRALVSEQRFTANAAHELKTPLAAIKAEVQRCQRLSQPEDTRAMLNEINSRVSRAAETVSQMLTLARLDGDRLTDVQSVNLGNLLLESLAEIGHLASECDVEFQLPEGLEALSVKGSAEWLAILFRNLLENAVKYSHEKTTVEITLKSDGYQLTLEILNPCDPIPMSEYEQLKDRFYRLKTTKEQGVGLGLSIVDRVANLHGWGFEIGPSLQGSGFCSRLLIPIR